MEIVNAARHTVSNATVMMDKDGQEYLVVAIKATYRIPQNNKMPRPVIPPQPLVDADIYSGEPGFSAPLYEADYVLNKPKCDVLFHASAYPAPEQGRTEHVVVNVSVSTMKKTLKVWGKRTWKKSLTGMSLHCSNDFPVPVTYDYALGGTNEWQDGDRIYSETHKINPIGIGYAKKVTNTQDGLPAPSIELINEPILSPNSKAVPQALSVLPRNSKLRVVYAGTYDEKWRKNVAPFLPDDFDEQYFQSAPSDQQIEYPNGKETVFFSNLMKDRPEVVFQLPRLDNLPLRVLKTNYKVLELNPVVDTLFFEPDESRFSVVWRSCIPLENNIHEVQTIAIGPICKNWWANKVTGGACMGCGGDKEPSLQTSEDI